MTAPTTRIRHAVKIISEADKPANLTELKAPLYTVKAELYKCTDYDEARAVFRNNKPANIKSNETGLFVRSVNTGIVYEPITADKVDIVTFDSDKIYVTENAKIIGCNDKAIYAYDTDGCLRQIKKENSFIILG